MPSTGAVGWAASSAAAPVIQAISHLRDIYLEIQLWWEVLVFSRASKFVSAVGAEAAATNYLSEISLEIILWWRLCGDLPCLPVFGSGWFHRVPGANSDM